MQARNSITELLKPNTSLLRFKVKPTVVKLKMVAWFSAIINEIQDQTEGELSNGGNLSKCAHALTILPELAIKRLRPKSPL